VTQNPVRDQAAISGVGFTDYTRESNRTVLELAIEACTAAIDDAGLSKDDIDGLICFHENDTATVRDVAAALGIAELNWWGDVLAGGTFSCAVVGEAAMAVTTKTARNVVVYRALNGRSGVRIGRFRIDRRDGVSQFMAPVGFGTPPEMFGMLARRHMHVYGTTKEQFGAVAVTQRHNAMTNPRAMRREPLTLEDYMTARVIADPYSLFDCCLESDGACALVVSATEVANDLRHPPVLVSGFVHGGGPRPRLPFDGTDDFTESCFRRLAPVLYDRAGVGPADIDVAELYDAYTFEVIHQLEQLGFCADGEGGDFVAEGRTARDGQLPVNTHGGLLSEAYIHGLNHTVEAVMQLRGTAGKNQVPGAEIALVTGFGFVAGSMLILRK
jgi:17-hydroxy-3-oxo-4-pregnene-20-carboxyl-CoA lyase